MKYAPLMKKAHSLAGNVDYLAFLNKAAARHALLGENEFLRRYAKSPHALVRSLGYPLRERTDKKAKLLKRYG